MSFKQRGYIKAEQVMGASDSRILFLHILPQSVYPAVAITTLNVGHAIVLEAGLSFLGLGDQNVISWGQIIYLTVVSQRSWWLVFFPGAAITLIVLGFNLLGDYLERRMKGSLEKRF
jgi:peptide/nickel transport system permease protein